MSAESAPAVRLDDLEVAEKGERHSVAAFGVEHRGRVKARCDDEAAVRRLACATHDDHQTACGAVLDWRPDCRRVLLCPLHGLEELEPER